jgi:hypothetical protein
MLVMSDEIRCSTTRSLSVVACVSDQTLLQANLLGSPSLVAGSPREAILVKSCTSAADGLNLEGERRGQALRDDVSLHFFVSSPFSLCLFPKRLLRSVMSCAESRRHCVRAESASASGRPAIAD